MFRYVARNGCLPNSLRSGWKTGRRTFGIALQNPAARVFFDNNKFHRSYGKHGHRLNWHDVLVLSSKEQRQQRRWIHSHPVRNVTEKSKIERTKKIVRYGTWQQWPRILELFEKEREDHGLVELSTTLSQLAKMKSFKRDHPVLGEIFDTTANCISKLSVMDARHYSNICHSIAKLKTRNDSADKIVNYLSDSVFAKEFLDHGNPQDISNLWWSLARLHRPDLMKTLLGQMSGKCENDLLSGDNPQHIANIAWACATLGYTWPALFTAIEERSNWLVTNGIPQAIANTAWACATLEYESPALFAAIENRSHWFVANSNPKGIATVAWACATLKRPSPVLFAAIDNRSEWLVAKSFHPQAIANTAWACAKLGQASPTLFEAIENRSEWFVTHGNPQDIANTAWACAKLGYPLPALFTAIAKRWNWLLVTGTKQSVINTRWAFHKLGYHLEINLEELKEAVGEKEE